MLAYLHIHNDDDGESHLSEGLWSLRSGDFTPPSPSGYLVSEVEDANGWIFMHHPPGYRDEWHTAPTRVLVIVLEGNARIQTSDGTERIIHPGDRILVEDTSGRGHKMEGVDGQAYSLALILLDGSAPEEGKK